MLGLPIMGAVKCHKSINMFFAVDSPQKCWFGKPLGKNRIIFSKVWLIDEFCYQTQKWLKDVDGKFCRNLQSNHLSRLRRTGCGLTKHSNYHLVAVITRTCKHAQWIGLRKKHAGKTHIQMENLWFSV